MYYNDQVNIKYIFSTKLFHHRETKSKLPNYVSFKPLLLNRYAVNVLYFNYLFIIQSNAVYYMQDINIK